jgi:quinol monooxygenase YgiN
MMTDHILISGWLEWSPEDRSAVVDLFRPMMARSQQEDGCLDYSMSPDAQHSGRIRVTELWTSEKSLADHLAADHTQEFRRAVSAYERTGRSLQKHTIASSVPM